MTKQDILIILDESGSMTELGDEPLTALVEFVEKQREVGGRLTLWTFNQTSRCLLHQVDLANSPAIPQYKPDGQTALYDSIAKAIKHEGDSEDVSCLVITDGIDNASVKRDCAFIHALVNNKQSAFNWSFTFLGANQDVQHTATALGADASGGFDVTPGSLTNVTRQVSETLLLRRRAMSKGEEAPQIVIPESLTLAYTSSTALTKQTSTCFTR